MENIIGSRTDCKPRANNCHFRRPNMDFQEGPYIQNTGGPISGGGSLGTFLPCCLFTVIPAPFFHRSGRNPRIKAFVEGVMAAAIGAIAGAAFILGGRAIVDLPTALIALGTLAVLVYV